MKNRDELFSPEPSFPKKIFLTDLISIAELQEMQDSFSEVANVTIRTVDLSGHFLTSPSNTTMLCTELFSNERQKQEYCTMCLPTFLGGEGMVDDDFSFECLPGCLEYLVPLKVTLSQSKSLILGYMIIGPVIFMKRKDKEEYRETAQKFDIELDALWNLILGLRVFSYKTMHSFLDMVDTLTSHIFNLAYTKRAMQKKILNHITKESSLTSAAMGQEDEFLELFLDLIMEMTHGSLGSIMLLDRQKRELVIKAARGLSQEIMDQTVVKLGEGLSGLAVQTKRSFLINRDCTDKVISDRLKKPELFSSVIVPLKYKDEIYGVVNVSSDVSFPVRFDETSLALITKASELASMTLRRF